MADLRIQHTEEMVGAGHPLKSDTLNRISLVEHNTDGTHSKLTKVTDPWVDVRAFGAAGDGSTDDTTAIGSALAFSRQIYFPPGTYLVAGDSLNGSSGQHLYFAPGAVLKLAATTVSKKILNYSAKSNVVIENPAFDLNTSGAISNIALNLNGSSNIRVRNPRIINSAAARSFPATSYGYGVYLVGAWRDVVIDDIYASDIMYGVITHPSSTGEDLTISKGLMEYLEGDGVEINAPTGSCRNIEIEGVTFYRCGSGTSTARGFGVGLAGAQGVNIHDNRFIDVVFQGVHVEDGSTNIDIHDNYFDNCGISAVDWTYNNAVYAAATTPTRLIGKLKVRGNLINTMGQKGNYGIYVAGSVDLLDVEISGNLINMNAPNPAGGVSYGIAVGSVVRYAHIRGNTVKNSRGAGMRIRSSRSVIKDNICYDDQATKTQTYGIEYDSNADYTIFENNILTGNLTGAFNRTSVPDGARLVGNIENDDDVVSFGVSTTNLGGRYVIDGPISHSKRRAVADQPYTMSRYDSYIALTSLSAGRTVTLGAVANLIPGHEVIIKDESGQAGTHNITVMPASGTIDGTASKVISADYGFLRLRTDGTNWFSV